VELVILDSHRGIQESVTRSFLGAAWQYCHTHFIKNLMKLIPKKKQSSMMQIVKQALENESLVSTAQDILVKEGLDKASEIFKRWYPSLYNYKAYCESSQKRLRTTNMLERLKLEFKRRTKKIGAYPSEQSLMRLVATIMMDINEEWITGRKYMNRSFPSLFLRFHLLRKASSRQTFHWQYTRSLWLRESPRHLRGISP